MNICSELGKYTMDDLQSEQTEHKITVSVTEMN